MLKGKGDPLRLLPLAEAGEITEAALGDEKWEGLRVLVVIPDHTRSGPLPFFFKKFCALLQPRVAKLDFLIALGTHGRLSEEAINRLVGITAAERAGKYGQVGLHNHCWDESATFQAAGVIPAAEIAELSGGLMREEVRVAVNRMVFAADKVIIWGPVFPHEVVGFSGGHKYFFPGIAGREIIDFTHWLGAVITSRAIIGTRDTPVRRVIERAAGLLGLDTLCFCPVVRGESDLAGLFVGAPFEAWSAAAELSATVHIKYVERPYARVLSVMPAMYEDIWTGAKGMYKMEPVIADGGEVVIYAPHITEISYVHGQSLDRIGYHVRDYFLKQWDRFSGVSRCVLAHSTHLRGAGTYVDGVEKPRLRVTLATGIPRARCEKLNLGYLDPAAVKFSEWQGREHEGILFVPRAGEMLYRLREAGS